MRLVDYLKTKTSLEGKSFSIACPYMGAYDYDRKIYDNLLEELKPLQHTKNSTDIRIYLLGWPFKKRYEDIDDGINLNAINILWLYGHPDRINKGILKKFKSNSYFLTASNYYQEFLKKKTGLQSDILKPYSVLQPYKGAASPEYTCDIAFIGNERRRPIVEDILPIIKKYNLNFKIFGTNWNNYYGNKEAIKYWIGHPIPFEDIPKLAKSAKIILHDHHASMNKVGIASHKYIDLIASGCNVISDFNLDVLYNYKGKIYKNKMDLESQIKKELDL